MDKEVRFYIVFFHIVIQMGLMLDSTAMLVAAAAARETARALCTATLATNDVSFHYSHTQ